MPKILTLKQLLKKKYQYLDDLPEKVANSLGKLVRGFTMFVWGDSGMGKSNFTMQILAVLARYGRVLYIGLEEGHNATMQELAARYFTEDHLGKISFANHTMNLQEAKVALRKGKAPLIIVVDSIQYWNISYEEYKELKEEFPRKIWIYISHTAGKTPDGKTANKIRYDSDIKVWVEGNIAFPRSRLGGSRPYVIYEPKAREYWGKDYQKKSTGYKPSKQKAISTKVIEANEPAKA